MEGKRVKMMILGERIEGIWDKRLMTRSERGVGEICRRAGWGNWEEDGVFCEGKTF